MSSTDFSIRTEKIPFLGKFEYRKKEIYTDASSYFYCFLSWQKRHEKCTRHRRKGRMFLAGLVEKRVTFPFTDSKVEFIETMSENYPILKDIKFDVFRAERNAIYELGPAFSFAEGQQALSNV